jgi:nucleoside-diphosphate-sugar epimerase
MNDLVGKRIFVTGGTGLLGKWLLYRLHDLPADVVVLTRNPAQFIAQCPVLGKSRQVTFVHGDVRDFAFPDASFDYVIHAANEATTTLLQGQPAEVYSVIVDGTRRVIDFSRHAGVKRLLYVSSGAVYGIQPPELLRLPETFACNPVTTYGRAKLTAEALCLESGLDAVLARCFAFVGPWLPLRNHFAIGNFIGNCLRNEPIVIKGDGTSVRSYMYGADLAEWLCTILLRGERAQPYNVGSSDAISIFDLAHRVRECAGTRNDIVVLGERPEDGTSSRYVPSVHRAETELELRQRCSLPDAICRTIDWYRRPHPKGVCR